MQLEVTVDVKACSQWLAAFASDQLPFICSLAVNNTAKKAQAAFLSSFQSNPNFILRKPWWKPGNAMGFNVQFGNKQDPTAMIYSSAKWIASFEEGETRTPRGANFALPTENVRRTKRDLIAPSNKPRALRSSFTRRLSGGKLGLFVALKRRAVLKYIFQPLAHIKPTLHFKQVITETVLRVWPAEFNAAFERAMRGAK